MDIGGTKQQWLFPDDLKPSDQLIVEITEQKEHQTKAGGTMPIVVLKGMRNNQPVDLILAVWNIESEEKIDLKATMQYEVTAGSVGKAFFKPVIKTEVESVK